MPETEEKTDDDAAFITNLMQISVFIAIFGVLALFIMFLVAEWRNPAWNSIAFSHFPATIGLPAAAVGAFVICALFRTAEGKIRFSILGMKFEGASGPIIMWTLCFLAIVTAIRLLWPLSS